MEARTGSCSKDSPPLCPSNSAQATLARSGAPAAVAPCVGPRSPDVICQTRTRHAAGADVTAVVGSGYYDSDDANAFDLDRRHRPICSRGSILRL
jgi:hypothetical protein